MDSEQKCIRAILPACPRRACSPERLSVYSGGSHTKALSPHRLNRAPGITGAGGFSSAARSDLIERSIVSFREATCAPSFSH